MVQELVLVYFSVGRSDNRLPRVSVPVVCVLIFKSFSDFNTNKGDLEETLSFDNLNLHKTQKRNLIFHSGGFPYQIVLVD